MQLCVAEQGTSTHCFGSHTFNSLLNEDQRRMLFGPLTATIREQIFAQSEPAGGETPSLEADKIPSLSSASRSNVVTRELPALTGSMLLVEYRKPGDSQVTVRLLGGKIGDYLFQGSMQIRELIFGSGYVWVDPKMFSIAGAEDVRVIRLIPKGSLAISSYLGAGLRMLTSGTDGLDFKSFAPRFSIELRDRKTNRRAGAPSVGLKSTIGPAFSNLNGKASVGSNFETILDLNF